MYRGQKRTPDFLERGHPVLICFPLLGDDGKAAVVPSSGTVTIYAPNGSKVVDAAATTTKLVDPRTCLELEAGDPNGKQAAAYVLTLAGDATLGPRWLLEWVLTIAGQTQAFTYKHAAAVVKQAAYPVVGEDDITKGRHRGIDTVLADSNNATLVDYIDTAWEKLVGLLIMDGRYPYQLLDSWALREPHITKALALIFNDAATNAPQNASYVRLAKQYGYEFEDLWGSFVATFDTDNSGLPSSSEPATVSGGSGLVSGGMVFPEIGSPDMPAEQFNRAGGPVVGRLPGRGWG